MFSRYYKEYKARFQAQSGLKKRLLIMLAGVVLLFGPIFFFQAFKSYMIQKYMQGFEPPPVTVSAQPITYQAWQPKIRAPGSLRAVQGVDITPEVAGIVKKIYFNSGDSVKKGDVLVELNKETDEARLQALEAVAELASITYTRDKEQYERKAVSKATLDADLADLKSKQAQVAEQAGVVAKKVIRAPFDGQLGISAIDEGQYLNPGDKIVSLQQVTPIYAEFYVPQQKIAALAVGKKIVLTVEGFTGVSFTGSISAIDSEVDPNTRNVYVEATLENSEHQLLPGMFGMVEVYTGEPQRYLTLPQSAVSYNPYGEIVYVIEEKLLADGKKILRASQVFVTLGETRGDQVAVLKGLKEGDQVITSGQLKLKNGDKVVINNAIVPSDNPMPVVQDE